MKTPWALRKACDVYVGGGCFLQRDTHELPTFLNPRPIVQLVSYRFHIQMVYEPARSSTVLFPAIADHQEGYSDHAHGFFSCLTQARHDVEGQGSLLRMLVAVELTMFADKVASDVQVI